MSEEAASSPTPIEKALAWLIDHSDGVVGLKADGTLMPWEEVLHLYIPWWSAEFSDKELRREAGDMPSCEVCGADIDEESGVCMTVLILGEHPDGSGSSGGSDE